MIKVTLLTGQELVINAELLETVEAAHDTTVTLTTGRRLVVRESTDEVVARVIAYRQLINVPQAARRPTSK